jgi:putative flippase GtrA
MWSRSSVTAVIATALDFLTLMGLVQLAGVDYRIATFVGTVVGAIANFWINRQWSFEAQDGRVEWQFARFIPVQVGSSVLHTLGVWALTAAGMVYIASKVVVATLAFLVWTYPMNRWFVFRRAKPSTAKVS